MSDNKIDIHVPPLGESVTEATLARWLKTEGSAVKLDEPLLELETDKVTLEVPAPMPGILGKILIPEGETVEVGALVGYLLPEGENSGSKISKGKAALPEQLETLPEKSVSILPAARKMITENNLDAAEMKGTGKGGRILKEDVIRALEPIAEATSPQAVSGVREEKRVPMSRLRKRIAERLKEAQNTAAILTTFNEIDMSAVMALRERMKDSFEKKHGVRLGFMSFFVHACRIALQEIPALNAEIQGDTLVYKNYYDVGVAVGTPQGLVVPVVRHVEQMNFAEIEKEIGRLGAKARDGKLTLEDLSGGTFTISNGGVYGSLLSTPILNPPQSGIFGMHKIQKRPVAVGEQVMIRPMMYSALSYDHRIVDGREAVTFLIRVKENLEDPERMLLGL